MSDAFTELKTIEIPDALPDNVPFVVDDVSVAFHLGFKARTLWWLLLKPEAAYRKFSIPKASGGVRQIHAPEPAMKLLLSNLRKRFLVPLAAELGDHVTAYRPGKSVLDAVKQHIFNCPVCAQHDVAHTCDPKVVAVGAAYQLEKQTCKACENPPTHKDCPRRGVKVHLDLKDFFPNTRVSWIREFLRDAGYAEDAARVMAALMTVESTVKHGTKEVMLRGAPQGAPTSGDICNLVADHRLDGPIKALAAQQGWRYTRYADDIYLSHAKNLDPAVVDRFIADVTACIENAGWRSNKKKQEVQRPGKAQRLLGTTLNQKPNIPIQQYRKFRSIVYRCWRDGFDAEAARHGKSPGQLVVWLNGVFNWFSTVNPSKAAQLREILERAKEKHGVQ